eukprot:395380-Amphidinium_carterae.1
MIKEYNDAFLSYSKVLQYTLTKVTKGEPLRVVIQCNQNNASGFETWRRLHVTYDQGEKAQQLQTLSRVLKPTWNNTTQQPSQFMRQFQNWRDEIYNNKNSTNSDIPQSMKMAMLLQNIQGDTKSHLLLTTNMSTPDFHGAATTVEDYYRIDNNYSAGTHGVKGKYHKGKGKNKTKESTTPPTTSTNENDIQY